MEKLNAPGGKSKASRELKWKAPVTITASVVKMVPIQRLTVSLPMKVILRYKSAMFRRPENNDHHCRLR